MLSNANGNLRVVTGFGACALEPRRRFVTERGKKKKKRKPKFKPRLTAWVTRQVQEMSKLHTNTWHAWLCQAFIHKMSFGASGFYTQFLLNQSDWSQLSYWGLVSPSISLFLSHDFFGNDL